MHPVRLFKSCKFSIKKAESKYNIPAFFTSSTSKWHHRSQKMAEVQQNARMISKFMQKCKKRQNCIFNFEMIQKKQKGKHLFSFFRFYIPCTFIYPVAFKKSTEKAKGKTELKISHTGCMSIFEKKNLHKSCQKGHQSSFKKGLKKGGRIPEL